MARGDSSSRGQPSARQALPGRVAGAGATHGQQGPFTGLTDPLSHGGVWTIRRSHATDPDPPSWICPTLLMAAQLLTVDPYEKPSEAKYE